MVCCVNVCDDCTGGGECSCGNMATRTFDNRSSYLDVGEESSPRALSKKLAAERIDLQLVQERVLHLQQQIAQRDASAAEREQEVGKLWNDVRDDRLRLRSCHATCPALASKRPAQRTTATTGRPAST